MFGLFTTAAGSGTDFSIQNPLEVKDFADLIAKVTTAIRNLAIPVAVVMILIAGFFFLTAAGNPNKVKKGKDILMYTAIGLAIIFIGGGFVDLIKSVIGAK